MDVPSKMQPLLKTRFDLLNDPITAFLNGLRPDWILYDFTSYWVPPTAAKIGASCAYVALFNASSLSFIGPPEALLGNYRSTPEDYTIVPDWIPFESDIVYFPYEVMKFMHSIDGEIATSDTVRFGYSIMGCDVVGIRSSNELESKWVELLAKLYGKIVLPIGFLFPDDDHDGGDDDHDESDGGKWVLIKEWLDKQRSDSVLYVALGSESSLSQEELSELALGLEQSGLPFLLVLRDPPGSTRHVLPEGFEDRVSDRGLVHLGWTPQVKILSHPSTRGFLTHCGWNSVIEGLGLGRVLVLLPLMNEQGLVARFLVGKGLGIEVVRHVQDGSLSREAVAKAVRLAMVEKEGEIVRDNARKMKGVFGDRSTNGHYIDCFIHYLEDNRKSCC